MADGLISWEDSDEGSKKEAMQLYERSTASYTGVYKDNTSSASHRSYSPRGDRNVSVRPGYSRYDYDSFRPDSAVSTSKRQIIKDCLHAYKNVGLIRNVIDLMGDFACQGVNLVHRDKSAESFYKQWFKSINGKERSERFLNNLYRSGQVVCYESYANVNDNLVKYMKSLGSDIKVDIPDYTKNQIPFAYTFFNPLSLDVKNDGKLYLNVSGRGKVATNMGSFSGSYQMSQLPKDVFDKLPKKLRDQISRNKGRILLEEDRLNIYHYKKDDWEQWADPMIHAIIDDVAMLEKMKLADLSALDGAISNIRLWTLGDFEHKILPTKEGIDRLRNILANNQGGGTMELVWGPELKFTESATQVHKFLGSEKYNSVWNAIYAGLGVPPTLTGMSGNGGGFTNNFISLKTLVERLQYGRDLLIQFWTIQVEKVRKAMGFRHAPEIVFDQMSLSDEAAEKNLLIQLADRNVISNETLLERFKEVPKVETVRLKREVEGRKDDSMPDKAGPFHNSNHNLEIEKMDKQHKFDKENQKFEAENRPKEGSSTPKSKSPGKPNGRPKNSKDSAPRKKRVETPKSKPGVAELIIWADEAWDNVSNIITKAYLGAKGKTNQRQITRAQAKELETMKVDVFTNLDPMASVTEKDVYLALKAKERTPGFFREVLKANGVEIDQMPLDTYRKSIIGLYVQEFSEV